MKISYITGILLLFLLPGTVVSQLQCDTLHYPLPGTPTIWTVAAPDFGYICGNNSYGDLAKADYFEPEGTGKRLYSGLFDFAYISMQSGEDPDIEFRVWDNSGTGGLPGSMVASATMKLSVIFDDVVNSRSTEVTFDPPVDITGPFYLGLMLPTLEGDTLALISTDLDEVDPGTAFELWPDSTWHAFSEPGGWDLKLTQAIYPVYCDVGFGVGDPETPVISRVGPNPSSDRVTLYISNIKDYNGFVVEVVNITGTVIHTMDPGQGTDRFDIDVSSFPAGMYLVRLRNNSRTWPGIKFVVGK